MRRVSRGSSFLALRPAVLAIRAGCALMSFFTAIFLLCIALTFVFAFVISIE